MKNNLDQQLYMKQFKRETTNTDVPEVFLNLSQLSNEDGQLEEKKKQKVFQFNKKKLNELFRKQNNKIDATQQAYENMNYLYESNLNVPKLAAIPLTNPSINKTYLKQISRFSLKNMLISGEETQQKQPEKEEINRSETCMELRDIYNQVLDNDTLGRLMQKVKKYQKQHPEVYEKLPTQSDSPFQDNCQLQISLSPQQQKPNGYLSSSVLVKDLRKSPTSLRQKLIIEDQTGGQKNALNYSYNFINQSPNRKDKDRYTIMNFSKEEENLRSLTSHNANDNYPLNTDQSQTDYIKRQNEELNTISRKNLQSNNNASFDQFFGQSSPRISKHEMNQKIIDFNLQSLPKVFITNQNLDQFVKGNEKEINTQKFLQDDEFYQSGFKQQLSKTQSQELHIEKESVQRDAQVFTSFSMHVRPPVSQRFRVKNISELILEEINKNQKQLMNIQKLNATYNLKPFAEGLIIKQPLVHETSARYKTQTDEPRLNVDSMSSLRKQFNKKHRRLINSFDLKQNADTNGLINISHSNFNDEQMQKKLKIPVKQQKSDQLSFDELQPWESAKHTEFHNTFNFNNI